MPLIGAFRSAMGVTVVLSFNRSVDETLGTVLLAGADVLAVVLRVLVAWQELAKHLTCLWSELLVCPFAMPIPVSLSC